MKAMWINSFVDVAELWLWLFGGGGVFSIHVPTDGHVIQSHDYCGSLVGDIISTRS